MFNQIISEIERELGIKFVQFSHPVLYCPNTFNPMRCVFVTENNNNRYNISRELINSSTWTVLMGSEGYYIYDVCIKTMIKDAVLKTLGDYHTVRVWGQGLVKFKIKKHKL